MRSSCAGLRGPPRLRPTDLSATPRRTTCGHGGSKGSRGARPEAGCGADVTVAIKSRLTTRQGPCPSALGITIPFAHTTPIKPTNSKTETLSNLWIPDGCEAQSQGIISAMNGQRVSPSRRCFMVWAHATSIAPSSWRDRSFANPMYTLRVVPQKHFFKSEWMCEFAAR